MRIISVGQYIDDKNVVNESYRSAVSFLDFDMLLWNPSHLFDEYKTQYLSPKHQGFRNIDDDDSPKLLDDINRRKNEILELIKLGRTVILTLPSPDKCYYGTGEREFSGTGRNRITTRIVGEMELFNAIPIKELSTVVAEGNNIELRGDEPFKSYYYKMKNYHFYQAYFSKPSGKPFLFVKGTNKPIASWIPTEKGVFIFLPPFYSQDYFKTKKEYQILCAIFIASVTDLSKELQKSTGDFSLPDWTKRFLLPTEKEQRSELSAKELQLHKALIEISGLKEKLATTEKYKILLSGSGRALERQVATVLSEIGFQVSVGTEERDDLTITFRDRVAVVEIKGVTKSAAEKHAAQLEKWVSEYMTDKGIKPKGLLIVNAYCETPIDARIDPAFPDQMIAYSVNREHCLLTTIQLLGLYLHLKVHPEETERLISELLNMNGIYKLFDGYSRFLQTPQELEERVESKMSDIKPDSTATNSNKNVK